MITSIVTTFGSFASMFALVVAIRPPDEPLDAFQGGLLGIGVALFIVTLFLEGWTYYKSRPLALKKDLQIRNYLYKWISRGGRVMIFTRDLSWINDNDQEMKAMLHSKAQRDELAICAPAIIPLMEEFRQSGAHVYDYPILNYVPQSRFTIINRERMDAQVAVGRRIREKHVIEEYSAGHHPVFSVANDLVEIITRLHAGNAAQDRGT